MADTTDMERLATVVAKMIQQGQAPLGEAARAAPESAYNADAAYAASMERGAAPSAGAPSPLPNISAPGADGLTPMQRYQLEQARKQIPTR